MKAVTLLASAAGTVSYTARVDHVIVGLCGIGATANQRYIISWDPSVTAAQFAAPSANGIDRNLIGATIIGAAPTILSTPITAGETVYVAFSAAGSAVIFLDDVV